MSHDTIAIAPSILACDFSQLARELDSIRTADAIHFDVMDGHFVPNLSFGVPLLQAVKRVSSLPVDAHIMVSNPEEQIGWYIDAGADSITIHMEAQTHIHRMIYSIKNAGRKAAVAINPGSAIESLSAVLPDIDMILVMSVNPGFGGQSFIPTTTQKVLRSARFAMSADTIRLLKLMVALQKTMLPNLRARVHGCLWQALRCLNTKIEAVPLLLFVLLHKTG